MKSFKQEILRKRLAHLKTSKLHASKCNLLASIFYNF